MDRELNEVRKIMYEQSGNINTEMEIIKKKKSGAENAIIEVKNSLEWLNNRLR